MAEKDESRPPLFSKKVILLLVVLFGYGLVQQAYRYVAKKYPSALAAAAQSTAPKQPPDLRLQSIQIGENLHKLQYEAELFLRKNPGKTAKLADLVGPGKSLAKLTLVAGEKYPAEILPGVNVTATLPDGTVRDWLTPIYPMNLASPNPSPKIEADWTPAERGKADAPLIFKAMIYAGRELHNPGKQNELWRLLHTKLRGIIPPLPPTFRDEVQTFLEDPDNPQEERRLVFDAFARAMSPVSTRFIMHLATSSKDNKLRQIALMTLCTPWPNGDEAFEQVWCESNDERLLTAVASPMAQGGKPAQIDFLLSAALSTQTLPEDQIRTAIAQQALREITKIEAVPSLVARLAEQPAMNNGGKALASVLARLGDEDAGKAIVSWLQKADEDASAFIQNLGSRPKNPELKAAYTAALDPVVVFHNEKNREAIRTHLAPPPVLHRLKNGSFEDGTLNGFSLEGSGQILRRWVHIAATDGQYMAHLDTMENAVDGLSTLTTEPFEVPHKMKTLLFDYDFAASVLLHPMADVLKCYIITENETRPLDLFSGIELTNCYQVVSRYDEGTGFRTACIPVQTWAGTGERIRIKFVLHGRGKLPERIPGTNRFDHNPLGGNQPGTVLFLDNFRLTPTIRTELSPIGPEDVSIRSDGKTVTIKTTSGAFPVGSTIYIREITIGNKFHELDLGTQKQVVFQQSFNDKFEHSAAYYISYSTPATSEGAMHSPLLLLHVDRE
ncbi:MAG: hypothetical protein IPP19_01095 [Verrucomicrobia bacterium]|nr:hypothetical protein [Verrucomicrobiota bacterium]